MATVEERISPHEVAHEERSGVVDWITTIDHKKVGILYITTALFFFLLSGLLALTMRAELAFPGLQFMSYQSYNEFFTMHGTGMIFFFATPLVIGLANYISPLQIGAPDVAYPRLNAMTYWMSLSGVLTAFSGFITASGAAAFGWTMYAPLSNSTYSPGYGADLWIIGVVLSGTATILGSINIMATIFGMRAPGLTMFRMSLFNWNVLITMALIMFSFPALSAGLIMTFIDRNFGGHFFNPAVGGDAVLYQHIFWFFGHPEVYIVILPFFGILSEVIPVFSRKPIFGYRGFVLATLLIGIYSFSVWAHHMFATGVVSGPFFAATTMLIAVPTGIKYFNWIATMWRGKISFETPMLFCMGFLFTFLIGGITGVYLASPAIDFAVTDTYYVVAHFHLVMAFGTVYGAFAGIYFWYPKVTGRMLDERLGKVHFWLILAGSLITFMPQFQLGLDGMVRRVADYPEQYATGNLVSSIGALLIGISIAVFVGNAVKSLRTGKIAGNDPWNGYSLEWATTSPPPHHNFYRLPPIRSERPVFDERERLKRAGAVVASDG
jgi:cytochrome c oxidase subunit I